MHKVDYSAEAYATRDHERRTTSPVATHPRTYGSLGQHRSTTWGCYPGHCDENCSIGRLARALPAPYCDKCPPGQSCSSGTWYIPGEDAHYQDIRAFASRGAPFVGDSSISRSLSDSGTSLKVRPTRHHRNSDANALPRNAAQSPSIPAYPPPLFSLVPAPYTRVAPPVPLSPSENKPSALPRLIDSPFASLPLGIYRLPPTEDPPKSVLAGPSPAQPLSSESSFLETPPWLLPRGPRSALAPFRPAPATLPALPKTYYCILRAPVDQADSSSSSSKPSSRSSSASASSASGTRGRKRKAHEQLESDSIPPPQPSCSCCDAASVRCLPARLTRNGPAPCARCRKLDLRCDHAFRTPPPPSRPAKRLRDVEPGHGGGENDVGRSSKRQLSYILNP